MQLYLWKKFPGGGKTGGKGKSLGAGNQPQNFFSGQILSMGERVWAFNKKKKLFLWGGLNLFFWLKTKNPHGWFLEKNGLKEKKNPGISLEFPHFFEFFLGYWENLFFLPKILKPQGLRNFFTSKEIKIVSPIVQTFFLRPFYDYL